MGKFNVGIGLYNDKLDVYTIKKGKFLKLNDQNTENRDILEKLKLIKKKCKRYFNTEEEIGAVLSLEDKLLDEVKLKVRNLIKLSGFVIKDDIKESYSIVLAYGLEKSKLPIFILDMNKNKSTINLLYIEENIDLSLELNIDINQKKDVDNSKIILSIKNKITDICNDLNLPLEYNVILIGDIVEDKAFNDEIKNEIPNIYNYRKELLAKGASIKASNKRCSIIRSNIGIKENKNKKSQVIDLGYFYYINNQFDKAKMPLFENLQKYKENSIEYTKSLIYLLDIHLREDNLDEALSINSQILEQDVSSQELIRKYDDIIKENGYKLKDKRIKNIKTLKYEIINLIDDGFEYSIETNDKILEYEASLYKNTSILNVDEEILDYKEIVKEISKLDEIIKSNNIRVFRIIRTKLEDMKKYSAYQSMR